MTVSLRRTTAPAATLVVAGLLATLAGCGSGGDRATDRTPASAPTTAASSPSASTGAYPTFAPADYTYRLRVVCYCPTSGPVDVKVSNGQVASATLASGPRQGAAAPSYAQKTINDIIAIANDPRSGHVKVVWPKGSDTPQRVTVSSIGRTTDAQISYVIGDVRAG
ncbi:MAG: DUF6174 domain-containing protein [Nocardioidaceae bacterium]|nr:DUF6174 domain-containing protein [Nocardioidaceae bacterium]MCL2614762.1 DUF6174 domain-containing protein [Nocardioidaceae bacterium]